MSIPELPDNMKPGIGPDHIALDVTDVEGTKKLVDQLNGPQLLHLMHVLDKLHDSVHEVGNYVGERIALKLKEEVENRLKREGAEPKPFGMEQAEQDLQAGRTVAEV